MALSKATSTRIFFEAASRSRISASASTSRMRVRPSAPAILDCSASAAASASETSSMLEVAARDLENEQVAEMVQQVGEQPAEVFAVVGQVVQLAQRALDLAGQHRARQLQQLALGRQAEHREHVRLLDLVAAKADELVEGGFGVAHGALGAAGDGVERGRVDLAPSPAWRCG